MRLFVAIELPADVRDTIDAAVRDLRNAIGGVRWTRPESWHLTLAFLGEVPAGPEPVTRALRPIVATSGRPELRTGAGGRFGDRVLWIGVVDRPAGWVSALGHRLQAALSDAGLPVDRKPVRPHLTLARRGADPIDLALADRIPDTDAVWRPAAVTLLRSQLGVGGARYERLASLSLGPAT